MCILAEKYYVKTFGIANAQSPKNMLNFNRFSEIVMYPPKIIGPAVFIGYFCANPTCYLELMSCALWLSSRVFLVCKRERGGGGGSVDSTTLGGSKQQAIGLRYLVARV